MSGVVIHGQGVAARCCARLLDRGGLSIGVRRGAHSRVPALVVSQATEKLLEDVFDRPGLLAGLTRIERRIVAWGPGARPLALPHSAAVVSEEELLARLQPHDESLAPEADWTVYASGHPPEPAIEQHFGTRRAVAAAAEMRTPEAACWVESLPGGWLFLIPGWLISVGGAPEALLADSRLVAGQIRAVGPATAAFRAYPRITAPLCAPGWLACGSAAMAFDPICGDGTGNAAREAILAAAVIRAAAHGEPVEPLLAHYRTRLTAAFHKHLQRCLQFYRSGGGGPWWQAEAAELERGLAWCKARLADSPGFQFRLEGFDLRPLSGG